MFRLIEKLLYPKTNAPEVAKILADILHVKITRTTLIREIESHPDYPSLLSISDVLNHYRIENVAIKLDPAKLTDVPVPFITQIRSENDSAELFSVVKEITIDTLSFFDPVRHFWRTSPHEEFWEKCSGTILLAAADEQSGEKEYVKIVAIEKRRRIALQFSLLFIPCISLSLSIPGLLQGKITSFFPVIYLTLALCGALLGAVLIWYELDQYNPVLSQICNAGKNVNCRAVLQSKGARIAGVGWSTIGLSYFMGQLFFLIFTGVNNTNTLFVLGGISTMALPYIFYSLYYQYRIAKQWCVLCVSVQGVLLLQFVAVIFSGWLTSGTILSLNPDGLLIVLTAFILPLIATIWLIPILEKAKESKNSQNKLQQLKHNPSIFEALLTTQKMLTESSDGLGITLGNPMAKYKVIKVCNPYCGPCAKAHLPMEQLLANNPDVQVQIIFTSTSNDDDYRKPPVKHLMAVAEKNDVELTKQALDDWYLAEKKDYTTFSAKHPMNGLLATQDAKIEAMSNWCDKAGINFTPTFFVSLPPAKHRGSQNMENKFHQLPDIYSVADLKYFLSY